MRTPTKAMRVALGMAFLGAGGQKLAGADRMVDEFRRNGYPRWSMYATGAVETMSALGMLAVLFRPALVPAVGLLLSATVVEALATHARLGDPAKSMIPPGAPLALAVAVFATRPGRPGGSTGTRGGGA